MAQRYTILVAVLGAWMVMAGCASKSQRVDAETARFLVGSQQALHKGDLRRAQTFADRAVNRQPRVADVHFQRGRVLSVMKQFDAAEDAYRQAVSLDPTYHEAWINLGHNASRQLKYYAALRYYEKAVAAEPAKVGVSIGRAYASLGKADSAAVAYHRALDADSTNAAAHLWLSVLYKNRGDLSQALEHARRALALDPGNMDYRYVIGGQLLAAGDLEAAQSHLQAVVQRQPWHYGAYYRLGRVMARIGNPDRAERLMARADSIQRLQGDVVRLEEVIRMKPEDPRPWIQMGNALQALGRHQKAMQAFRVAETLASPTP
jgi:tetratricopeptide (TPR) repeat protein